MTYSQSAPPLLVGLADTGINGPVALARRHWLAEDGTVADGPAAPDVMGHGTALADLIRERVPGCGLLSAQVFDQRGIAMPLVVAGGIRWLVESGARIVNMSFGLREDRPALAEACAEALAAGVLLVASAPAMGGAIFPAAYPGVVKVTGDARCGTDDLAVLDGERADFGASPRLSTGRMIAGASVATARVTAMLAAMLAREPHLANAELLERLRSSARYLGPQTEHLHAR